MIALASDTPLNSPSASFAPTAAPVATPAVAPAPIDRDLLFANQTIDAVSGWGQLSVKRAAFDISGGSLASTYERKGSWAYAVRELAAPETVVRVGGTFTSSGLGYFGWLCGDSATGRYYGAVPETDGSLVFIDGGYAGVEPLERYEDLGAPILPGSTTILGIECAIDHGTLWMQAFLDSGEPIAVHEEAVDDVAHFDVIGMYGEALEPGFTTAVSDVWARGAGGATGALPFDAVPVVDYAAAAAPDGCQQATRSGNESVALECYLQDEGTGPELIELSTYPDQASMDAAYAASSSASSCPGAPPPTPWSRGSMRCVAEHVGIRLEWTDSSLSLMGTLVDFDGNYEATLGVQEEMLAAH